MARMIPSVISPEVKSNAERKIFEWFRDDPETDGWVVIHSLGIANHRTVLYGELDFFVIAPKLGVFALEVKGGRVRCEDGIWLFTNKYNQTTSKSRGPFAQANEGMFSLMDAVRKKYGPQHRLSNLLYGTGVMFPDISFAVEGTEGEQWQVFDDRDGHNVGAYIKKLSRNTRKKWEEQFGFFPAEKLPDAKDVKELANMLRGNFDKVMSTATQINYSEDALISLTEEQFRCLDQLEDNPRCLIRGSAGTGKTLLAIEAAKKAAISGEKVAFFCFNSMLGSWLKRYFERENPELQPAYVGTIHAWMTKVAALSGLQPHPAGDDLQHYYQEELPLITFEALDKSPLQYDRIIIDEAQDIIGSSAFDILDVVLKNGLARGKWFMFGDFTNQAIFNQGIDSEKCLKELEDTTSFIKFRLKINCRNTKQIGDEIRYITGFDSSAYLWTKVAGVPVEYKTYKTREEELHILQAVLDKLIKDGVEPGKITILSPYKRESSVASAVTRFEIRDYKPEIHDMITFSTVQSYKGLENAVIILSDVDTFAHERLMYVGLSRARSGLYILETEAAEGEHVQLLMKAVTK